MIEKRHNKINNPAHLKIEPGPPSLGPAIQQNPARYPGPQKLNTPNLPSLSFLSALYLSIFYSVFFSSPLCFRSTSMHRPALLNAITPVLSLCPRDFPPLYLFSISHNHIVSSGDRRRRRAPPFLSQRRWLLFVFPFFALSRLP